MMMDVVGTLFAIKRFSLHDGPHLRTTVFFSGCPLQCRWCHNPEGISAQLRTVSSVEKCIGCGECIDRCPQRALDKGSDGIGRDQKRCDGCGECVRHCPALVHEQTGWQASVGDVMSEIEKDLPFYDQSGGGVTFSGGEPFAQPEFLLALLRACGDLSLHRTIDTSVYTTKQLLLEAVDSSDLMLCDIKHMDPVQHKKFTGIDNRRILENIRLLADSDYAMRIRLPLIPGVNDSRDNIEATIAFIKQLGTISSVDVLPYHQAAKAKYNKLGTVYPGDTIPVLSDSALEQTIKLLAKHSLEAVVGG